METSLENTQTRISEKITPRKEAPSRLHDQEANRLISQTIDIKALEAQVHHPFRDTIIEALARLTLELGDRFGQYDTIISDDASGRLMALLLKDIADRKRKEKDKSSTRIFFIAGGQHKKEDIEPAIEAVEKFIMRRRDELGKTLLVTEHISSGKSTTRLINILEDQGIDFDVATISIFPYPDSPTSFDYKLRSRLYYGEISTTGDSLWKQTLPAGVHKVLEGPPQAHPVKHEQYDPALVKQAREDIKLLGEELYKLISH